MGRQQESEVAMKRFFLRSAPLLAAMTSTWIAQAAPPDLSGSDTLEELASDLIENNCDGAVNVNLSTLLDYVGGGSVTASNAMIAQLTGGSRQVAGPMSRAISLAECTQLSTTVRASVQGLVFGLDGIVVVGDSKTSETCGGGHTEHGDDATPGPAFSDLAGTGDTFTYTGGTYTLGSGSSANEGWKDLLRLLYTGLRNSDPNPTPTAASLTGNCKSEERKALAGRYTNLFHGGCTDSSVCPSGLRHAFRRGDLSGTTDTFLSLISAPTNILTSGKVTKTAFCNGLETEDRDPIRRTCDETEQVCEADGTLGLILPIVVPTSNLVPSGVDQFEVLYNAARSPGGDPLADVARFGKMKITPGASCINGPQATAPNPAMELAPTKPDWNPAAPGTVGWNLPTGYRFPNNPRCDCRYPTPEDYLGIRDSANVVVAGTVKNTAFAWNKRSGGCPAVYRGNGPAGGTEPPARYGLLNGQDPSGDNSPGYWGATYVSGTRRICCANGGTNHVMDPRVMNLQLRDPAPSGNGGLLGGTTSPVTTTAFYRIHSSDKGRQVIPNRNTQAYTLGTEDCEEGDATRQIACLVQIRSFCSIGFAGREASDTILALTAESFAVGRTTTTAAIDPTIPNIQKLVDPNPAVRAVAYPLARRLYYNTLIGFGNGALTNPSGPATTYENAQFNLYKCMADASDDRANGISASLKALDRAGFVELPGGPKLCNDMCTTNPSCTTLTPVPAAHLLPAFVDPP